MNDLRFTIRIEITDNESKKTLAVQSVSTDNLMKSAQCFNELSDLMRSMEDVARP